MTFSPELKKGSIEMLVLSLLEGRPRHGYDIGKRIEERSAGKLKFALPTLYPTGKWACVSRWARRGPA